MNVYIRAPGGIDEEPDTCTTSDEGWVHYYGSYDVPIGQTETELAFESTDSFTGYEQIGNILDGIRLYTQSYIDLAKSNNAGGDVALGKVVTYTIKAKNLGESDASGVILSDILPEGTALVNGSVKIDGTATINYSYTPATRALTVPIGANSTASTGGLILGDGSFSADCANEYIITFDVTVTDSSKLAYENQAKVVYKDRYHEDTSDYTNYSNVDAFAVPNPRSATITDVLPLGVTYVTHTNSSESLSKYDEDTNTITWSWNELPYGKTVVTVTVKVNPDNETLFVNQATTTLAGMEKETNKTYHEMSGAILHLRQVVLGYSGNGLPPLAYTGFFTLENDDLTFGVTSDSNKEGLTVNFREINIAFTDPTKKEYKIKDIVPQYYMADGYIATDAYNPSGTDLREKHDSTVREPDNDIVIDFSDAGEYWVTVFIRPNTDAGKNDWGFKTNDFGTLYPTGS